MPPALQAAPERPALRLRRNRDDVHGAADLEARGHRVAQQLGEGVDLTPFAVEKTWSERLQVRVSVVCRMSRAGDRSVRAPGNDLLLSVLATRPHGMHAFRDELSAFDVLMARMPGPGSFDPTEAWAEVVDPTRTRCRVATCLRPSACAGRCSEPRASRDGCGPRTRATTACSSCVRARTRGLFKAAAVAPCGSTRTVVFFIVDPSQEFLPRVVGH